MPLPSTPAVTATEYAVYSAYLEQYCHTERYDMLWIYATTTSLPAVAHMRQAAARTPTPSAPTSIAFPTNAPVFDRLPTLQSDTYAAFLAVNQDDVPLEPRLRITRPYRMSRTFRGVKRTNARSFTVAFSRIGFSATSDQALVQVGIEPEMGEGLAFGAFVLLLWDGLTCLYEDSCRAWMS